MAYPLVFSILGSISTKQTYLKTVWLPMPDTINLTNYVKFFNIATDATTWIFNTLLRIVWYIFIPSITSVLCGYVFSKLKFRGRNLHLRCSLAQCGARHCLLHSDLYHHGALSTGRR